MGGCDTLSIKKLVRMATKPSWASTEADASAHCFLAQLRAQHREDPFKFDYVTCPGLFSETAEPSASQPSEPPKTGKLRPNEPAEPPSWLQPRRHQFGNMNPPPPPVRLASGCCVINPPPPPVYPKDKGEKRPRGQRGGKNKDYWEQHFAEKRRGEKKSSQHMFRIV